MIAVEISRPGGPEMLQVVERPVPRPEPGEVLIRVEAAGVNRPDIMQRTGRYPPPPGASDIPGLEVAGTIEGTGERVCALVAGGGYAQYCVAPRVQCLPIPKRLTAVEAAAIPETFFTVWSNVFERGGLRAGASILVHGGTSGIGTTAIQLARARGAVVFATAGSDDKCRACVDLGATAAINYNTQDFVAAIRELTSGNGVDVILDIVGADYVQRNIDSLAADGRLVQIGMMGGPKAQLNLVPLLQRRLTVTGSTLRARSVNEKGRLAREVEANIWPLLESGAVGPIVYRTFPLEGASAAHEMLESGAVIGKIVLTCG